MTVFQNGVLRLAWLASLIVALGTRRNGTGLVLLQPEPKIVESVQQMEAFQFDAMPIVPDEVLSQDKLAKNYHNPGTMRKVKTPVMPSTKRKIPSMGGAAVSKRRLTTQAIASAATMRKVQQDSWRRGETQPQIQARGRKEATHYDFDPASSIMQAVGTRRRVGGGQQQTVSKGYVSPTARHVGPSRRDQTRRQMKPAQSMRVATTRKTGGTPTPPPPPPSFARKSTRPLQKSVPARPAVLQQAQSPRRILGTSTRRVVAPTKKAAPVAATRRPEQTKYTVKMPTRREVLRIAEETEEESSVEQIVPAKTRRAATKQPAAYGKPQKGKKKPVKAPTLSSTEITSTSDLSEAEDSSSSEPPMQTRRRGKKPVATKQKKKPTAKKPAATQRKVVKETATKRKQPKAEPTKQKTTRKAVAAVESDSDDSTSSDSFERQFTRRQVLKAKPKKLAVKETKRKVRKVVEPSSSSSIEEETTSSQVSSSSVPESTSSSSSEYVQTRRKGKPAQTKRKVQTATARKVKKPVAKPAKQPKGKQGKGKKQKKEETITESVESSVPQPPRKQAQTARKALAPKWKKEEPTTRKVEATKRKATAGTKRDVKVKEKARPRGKYVSSETESSVPLSSTVEPSSSSYRPTRRQAAVQTKKKLGYGTPTKRRH